MPKSGVIHKSLIWIACISRQSECPPNNANVEVSFSTGNCSHYQQWDPFIDLLLLVKRMVPGRKFALKLMWEKSVLTRTRGSEKFTVQFLAFQNLFTQYSAEVPDDSPIGVKLWKGNPATYMRQVFGKHLRNWLQKITLGCIAVQLHSHCFESGPKW